MTIQVNSKNKRIKTYILDNSKISIIPQILYHHGLKNEIGYYLFILSKLSHMNCLRENIRSSTILTSNITTSQQ